MRAPVGAVSGRLTRTLLALIDVHRRDGRATTGAVAAELGHTSSAATADALGQLRDLGLVAWDDGARGTLRPLFWPADQRIVMDTVEHIVCCHEPTAALCGATTDGSTEGEDADCVVCLDLAHDYEQCPIGARCHLAEKQPRSEP